MNPFVVVFNRDKAPIDSDMFYGMLDAAAHHPNAQTFVWEAEGIAMGQKWFPVLPEDEQISLPVARDGMVLIGEVRLDNRAELILQLANAVQSLNISDIELTLLAYQEWGDNCPKQLVGAFAFALWDSNRDRLLVARDVMGIRTVYFAEKQQTICISTTARQLTRHSMFSNAVDNEFVLMWLMGIYLEGRTIFSDVKSLLRGHMLSIRAEKVQQIHYWDWSEVHLRQGSTDSFLQEFKALLLRSVQDRSRSRQPLIGAHTSGGMDSTSITALAAQAVGGAKVVQSYAWRFETLMACDESAYSLDVTRFLKLPDPVWIDAEQYWIFKGAFSDPEKYDFPLSLFRARDQYTSNVFSEAGGDVLLTGVAGDNLTMGVPPSKIFSAQLWRGDLSKLPKIWRELRNSNDSSTRFLRAWILALIPPALRQRITSIQDQMPGRLDWISKSTYREYDLGRHFLPKLQIFPEYERQQLFELTDEWFLNKQRTIQYLHQLGATTGVEFRHPLFDQRLIAFVLSMPSELLRIDGIPKGFLRRTMSGQLPKSVLGRREKPWLREMYHEGIVREASQIKALFAESILAGMGLIDAGCLLNNIDNFINSAKTNIPARFMYTVATEVFLKKE